MNPTAKYLLKVRQRGKYYHYFRPGRLMARHDIPVVRLSDDANEASAQAELLGRLTDNLSAVSYYRHVGGLLHDARQRARRKGDAFGITGVDIVLQLVHQDCRCALTGLPLDLERHDTGDVRPLSPRLNRISPRLGYTAQNVRIVGFAVDDIIEAWGWDALRKIARGIARRSSPPSAGAMGERSDSADPAPDSGDAPVAGA